MPAMIVSLVSSSLKTLNVGSSLRNRCRALLILSASARLTGVTETLMTGLGTNMLSSEQYLVLGGVGIAAGAVDAHDGDDVAGLGRVDFFPLVGVHLHDAAEAVLAAGALVVEHVALGHLALIDAHEGELAERIFDDLERHADERLGRIGLERQRLRRVVPLLGRDLALERRLGR